MTQPCKDGGLALRIRPWTVKRSTAIQFNSDVHRRRPRIQGGMWCVSVRRADDVVGIAIVGWPSQEQTSMEMDHLRVLRVAAMDILGPSGHANCICSRLYSACWKAGRAMGVTSMDTFTDLDEPGTSLRAAGWIEDGTTTGGEYDRPSRRRKPQVNAGPKRRWWAPGSAKLVARLAGKGPTP
jgi:hypothetical protein